MASTTAQAILCRLGPHLTATTKTTRASRRLLLISGRRPSIAPALLLNGSILPLAPRRHYSSNDPGSSSGKPSSAGSPSSMTLGQRLRAMFNLSYKSKALTGDKGRPQAQSAGDNSTDGDASSAGSSPSHRLSQADRRRALQARGPKARLAPTAGAGSISSPSSNAGRGHKLKAALAATAVGFDEDRAKRAIYDERAQLKRRSAVTRAERNAQRAGAAARAREKAETLKEKWNDEEAGRGKGKGKGGSLPQPGSWLEEPSSSLAPTAQQGQPREVGRRDGSISGHALWTSEAASASGGWGADALAPGSERDIGRPFEDETTPEMVESERWRYASPASYREALDKAKTAGARKRRGEPQRNGKAPTLSEARADSRSANGLAPPQGVEPTTLHFGPEAMAPFRRVRKGDGASVNDGYLSLEELNLLQRDDEEAKWRVTRGGKMKAKDFPLDKVKPLREMDVPVLAHGLDRVLFNPGVYWLRDPRTGIFNFDPVLSKIPDVDLFDYAALPAYVTSSKDQELAELMRREGRRYCGSTSSLTGLLSQIYFLVSAWRGPDLSGFSEPFSGMPSGFSFGATLPAAIMLRKKSSDEGGGPARYAIDADKGSSEEPENSNYVLMQLGKAMEKMLTSDTEEFERYMRVNSHELTDEERGRKESYHYAMTEKLMMRSQLDCSDPRLPNATFDLKSRAVIAIRRDRANWVESSGYMIRKSTGLLESFEREMFDMLRSAFLKYYFQARIGHMDGIFVAYHSTAAMYGFEYMPIESMAERLFGSVDMAEQAFRLSIRLLETILDEATRLFPDRTLRLTLETSQEGSDSSLNVFIEPQLEEGEVEERGEAQEELAVDDGSGRATVTGGAEDVAAAPGSTVGKRKGGRSIALLQVDVDRYLDGGLVRGPVDFEAAPGRQIDLKMEDEIERRRRSEMPPVQLRLEWSMSPRPDLSEAQIRQMLEATRAKQAALKDLILPNVSAINEREAERESLLAVNPAALARFREERESGVAPGMPRAPGQIDPGAAGQPQKKKGKKANDEERGKDEGEGSWRRTGQYISRLRRLARLGAEDAAKDAMRAPVLFESRGPSSSSSEAVAGQGARDEAGKQ